jgi:hypothetical protein
VVPFAIREDNKDSFLHSCPSLMSHPHLEKEHSSLEVIFRDRKERKSEKKSYEEENFLE